MYSQGLRDPLNLFTLYAIQIWVQASEKAAHKLKAQFQAFYFPFLYHLKDNYTQVFPI